MWNLNTSMSSLNTSEYRPTWEGQLGTISWREYPQLHPSYIDSVWIYCTHTGDEEPRGVTPFQTPEILRIETTGPDDHVLENADIFYPRYLHSLKIFTEAIGS